MNHNEFAEIIKKWYPKKTDEQMQRWDANKEELHKAFQLVSTSVSIMDSILKKVKYGKELDEKRFRFKLASLGSSCANWDHIIVRNLPNLSPYSPIIHYVAGMIEESTEVFKEVYYPIILRNPYNIEKIIEELGDAEHYFTRFTEHFCLDRGYIRDKNVEKCQKRFGESYSDQKAIERNDETNS